MLTHRTIIALTLCTFILQACGNVPQPFRPLPESARPVLVNPGSTGIAILPLDGIDDETAGYIAQWIAADLQSREIPAEALEKTGILGLTLEGNLRDEFQNGPNTNLIFDWRILDRSGEIVERLEQVAPVNSSAWLERGKEPREQVARDIASRLALMIAPQVEVRPPLEPVSRWADTSVSIQRPQNAPGDGAQALGRALASRLGNEGFRPAADRPDVVLGAIISVSQYDATQDEIAIVWQVLAPDGENLGEVRLDNRISRGSLDGAWGLVADAIVDAAFPGILEIISASRR